MAHILGQSRDPKRDLYAGKMDVSRRENSVILLEDDYSTDYQGFDPNSPESYISHQLQWMAYYESSLLFASEVVTHLIKAPLVPRRIVVDQDIFQVLVEANMPAVLLELAFVTNPTEHKYLASESGQNEVAARLFNAFKSYKTKFDASVNVDKTATASGQSESVSPENTNSSKSTEETYYSIQIMALGRKLSAKDPNFKGLECNAVKAADSSVYKYIYGKFASAKEAASKLAEVKKKFTEAFVVEVNGDVVKRIKL